MDFLVITKIHSNQRNIEEVKRLMLNFEKQLRDLILSLYFSSKSIWNFSYNYMKIYAPLFPEFLRNIFKFVKNIILFLDPLMLFQ